MRSKMQKHSPFDSATNDRIQFSCHLDDRRDLVIRRDFSSHTRRNDSVDEAFRVSLKARVESNCSLYKIKKL